MKVAQQRKAMQQIKARLAAVWSSGASRLADDKIKNTKVHSRALALCVLFFFYRTGMVMGIKPGARSIFFCLD